jgi:hypothetical protein
VLLRRLPPRRFARFSGRSIRRGGLSPESGAALVLGTMLCVFGLMVYVGRGVQPRITAGADVLHVEALSFETNVAYADVDSIELRPMLQGLGRRLGGMQSGNSYVGQFEVVPFGPTMLFVDARRKPLIYFYTRKGVVVVTVQDSLAASALARDVRSRMARKRQR